ncbi:hypothetical protein A6V39_00730 [Candidatus Mycoplasma haematobovis]|uniref:Uncharacterized protein n=1 Tax=Candidatus Mycoplasma haematobovis TaxID=432608 RepID=A0A1A9QF50_9MOLU|nr:hypothetical protein [Candidatus Mycoplasma haematobovis]OAL10576.1 hypothetical protein A6V39_00730 [Candidatus Mycoplasma haematobovis]
MSIGAKLGMATLSAGAIGGASYGGYVYFSKDSFASKLGISILKLTGKDDETIWGKRLEELKLATGLPTDLEALKASGKTWKDLQKWCATNSSKSFERTTNSDYQNFEKFCTWKMGDKDWNKKIDSTVRETEDKWGTAHTNLKAKADSDLSESLRTVKNTVVTSDRQADRKAMHKWCTDNYKKTWIGNDDKEFKEVQTYCQA